MHGPLGDQCDSETSGPKDAPLRKFTDPYWTAKGELRAVVAARALETLWFNTGTLCNLTCSGCYIESSPRNDRLAYLSYSDVHHFLQEVQRDHGDVREIGFTGGEPFMNPQIAEMLETTLDAGFRALILTNAMTPMRRYRYLLLRLRSQYPGRLALRVSLDHYTQGIHERIRGQHSWIPAIDGLRWLSDNGFDVAVAARIMSSQSERRLRHGFAATFAERCLNIDAHDPHRLVLFPEIDESADVPEISEHCWNILGKSPADVMCATSRMVIKRKGEDRPVVVSCTLLPYDEQFEMGQTLAEAHRPVRLNHPHCAKFCVLGGASCSA